MIELTHKRKWDSKVFDTGRVDEKERPVYGTRLQDGLHDIEPDGSFVECVNRFRPYVGNVSTDEVVRGRGKVKISDTGSESKDRVKVTTKRDCGISLKLKGYRTYGPNFDTLKDTYYDTYDGITLRYYPNHNGVNIIIEVANPQTASNVFRFTIKEYGCSYTYEKIEGGIKCISSTGEDDIYIKALYAIDATGENGSVDIFPDGVDELGYQIAKKVVNPIWLGNAVGPVLIDPSVTIDDDTGTFEDTISYNGAANNNYGATVVSQLFNQVANKQSTFIKVLLTSLAGKTVTDAYFGFDVFGNAFPLVANAHVILVPWAEGTKSGSAASAGELTYNSSEHSIALWNTANCKGDGTDRVAAVDGTYTFTAINSDTHFPVSSTAVQGMIDTPSTNYGWVFETLNTTQSIAWRSSEAVTGNKPYIFIEYTEGANGFPFFFGAGHY